MISRNMMSRNMMSRSMMSRKLRAIALSSSMLLCSIAVFATTPTITVTSPTNDSKSTSPVEFKATASSPDCSQGISAMRVYSAPGVVAYNVYGAKLNVYLNLTPGTNDTTIVTWDYCGGTASVNLAVTVSGQKKIGGFLYTVNSGYDYGYPNANSVVGYSIVASNGALAPLLQGPVNTNIFPQSVASDKGGYRLYVGDWKSGDVFAYFIDRSNGYLTPVPGAPFPVNRAVTAVAVHPSGDYVYAAASEQAAGDGIAVFQLQSNGSLTEISGSPFATQPGPQALAVDPAGHYLYVADYSNYIEVFQINPSTGALSEAAGSPYEIPIPAVCNPGGGATANPTDIIDVSGTSLYTPDDFIGYISGWTISSTTGGLTPMSGSAFRDGGCATNPNGYYTEPWSLAIDGTGKFMYVNNSQSLGGIQSYTIKADGALTPLKSYANTSGGQLPIRTDATGKYLYTGGPGGIAGYRINETTGEITPLPTSPVMDSAMQSTTNVENIDSFTVTP
jgi:6-phosphogluconolactonase (cycloisomerase 2 family)